MRRNPLSFGAFVLLLLCRSSGRNLDSLDHRLRNILSRSRSLLHSWKHDGHKSEIGLVGSGDPFWHLKLRHMERMADVQRDDIDIEKLWNFHRQTFHLDLAHDRLENPAADHSRRLADEMEWNLRPDLRGKIDLIEIRMEDLPGNRMKLHLLDESH